MNVACVVMQRNEEAALEPWLRYHGYLFGYDNLYVIDHHSDLAGVVATLAHFERYGVHVTRLPPDADFRDKGRFVSDGLREAERAGRHDILLPLDCDEFVAMRDAAGAPTCARVALIAYLETLARQGGVFQVAENLLNTLGQPGNFWALPYQKVFFSRDHVQPVDEGSHTVADRPDIPVIPTRLVYVHFHFKSYELYQRQAAEKLRAYVDVTDRAALADYRGIGWHLVPHLLKTRDEFAAMMVPNEASFTFTELCDLLRVLGVDPLFCER